MAQLRVLAEVLDLTGSPSKQTLRMFVTNTLGNPDDEEGHIRASFRARLRSPVETQTESNAKKP